MKRLSALMLAFALLAPQAAHAEPHRLEFVKRIGPGWQIDKSGWMSFAAFSRDGRTIASDAAVAPDDISGDLTLWSFPGGKLIKRVPARPSTVSGDLKYYAGDAGVFDLKTGRTLMSLPSDARPAQAFSPNGRYVAQSWSGLGAARIRVIGLPDGRQVSAFGEHTAFSLAISPDGRTLASGHWDVVTLWDIPTGRRLAVLRGFGRYVVGLSFSRNGRLLAGGTDSGGVQIWDVRGQRRLRSIEIGGGYVSDPAFSPNGRELAVGVYGTGSVWLVDVRRGTILDHRQVSGIGCGSVAFSPDGRFLITPSSGGLVTWPYDRGGTIRVFRVRAG